MGAKNGQAEKLDSELERYATKADEFDTVNANLYEINTRLDSLQKDHRQQLYFNAWFTLGTLLTVLATQYHILIGLLVACIWLANAGSIMLKMQRWMKA